MKKRTTFTVLLTLISLVLITACTPNENNSELIASVTEETLLTTEKESILSETTVLKTENTIASSEKLVTEESECKQENTVATTADKSDNDKNIVTTTQIEKKHSEPDQAISDFHFTVSDNTGKFISYNITPKHEKLSVFIVASDDSANEKNGFLNTEQIKNFTEVLNNLNINEFDSINDSNGNFAQNCEIDITYCDGENIHIFNGNDDGMFDKVISEVRKLEKLAYFNYSMDDLQKAAQFGIEKAVDVIVYSRSYLRRYIDLGGDCSVYAGKTITLEETKSGSDVNIFGDDNIFTLPSEWYGTAYIRFTSDGKDIEYVNWADNSSALSEEKLVYGDLEAYFLENGIMIGTTL